MLRPYQKLIAWQESYRLCLSVYHLSKQLPFEERFGLTSQLRRATSSVPLNIAEGNSKRSNKEKTRFIDIALGSLNEVHCTLLLSKDLTYITEDQFKKTDDHLQRVSFLLLRLRDALN
jgi:four helix bundle protein